VHPRKIVLGLGNPGLRYRRTRHNVGFRVLDRLAGARGVKLRAAGELRTRVWIAECADAVGPVILAKPRCYMNRSGRAGAALGRYYGLGPPDFLVVHDDADLELGRIRIRSGGGTGGHNGIRSLVEVFGSDAFDRIKLGVRGADREEAELADYVLSRFRSDEEPVVEELVGLAAEAIEVILSEGLGCAMNRYNGRDVGGPVEEQSEP
jgi:PTH1 family peptidyl-tRNA hydrolase